MARSTDRQPAEFEEKLIAVSRVSKKTKGGDQMGFTALMVVGDGKGKVGVGLGKAKDVMTAVQKGTRQAKKRMIQVPINDNTIPFAIECEHGAGRVLLKPASKGSGVIAGGPVRAVVEAAGIKDISAKILGSQNKASSVYATFEALIKIKQIVEIKGIKIKQMTTKSKPQSEQTQPVETSDSTQKTIAAKTELKKVQPVNEVVAKVDGTQKKSSIKLTKAEEKVVVKKVNKKKVSATTK